MALPPDQLRLVSRAELDRNVSDVYSIPHAATKVANIEQEPEEHMQLYCYWYSKICHRATGLEACFNNRSNQNYLILS